MKNKIPTNLIVVGQPNKQIHLSDNKIPFGNQSRTRKVKFRKWTLVEEYCENSTVHGLRYFSKQNIHHFERLWWIISVACSMVACCILISKSYKKWNENPVIVTFSEKMTPLKDIPFPAVTICPETKSQRSIFNYTATLLKLNLESPPSYGLTEKEFTLACAQFQVCDSYIHNNENNLGDNFTNNSIFDLIREVAPNMSLSLITCTFRTYVGSCDSIFQEIMTDDGLCFTFNSLTSNSMFMDTVEDKVISNGNMTGIFDRWTLEDAYGGQDDNSSANEFFYPYRVFNAGSKSGLRVIMATREEDMDYACRGPVQGFKVILHTPNELPQVDGQYFRVPVGQDVRVSIKPNVLRTTKTLKGYHPTKSLICIDHLTDIVENVYVCRRQCFFSSERKLRYLRTYSKRNCELECLTNFTLDVCACVKFSMPHDPTTPICGIAKVNCYTEAENALLEDTDTFEKSTKINSCNCLPACTSIAYDSEISQATYEWKNYFRAVNYTAEEAEGLQFASLSIFFKENQFITSKRNELVGLTDFVSDCGGLLGLFMGVSILSIVEFIYYFSLRLFCSIQSSKADEKRKTLPKLKSRSKRMNQPIRPWYIGQT